VVALEDMPPSAHLAQPQQLWWLVIPEACPPGEGTVFETDKVFWKPSKAEVTESRKYTPPA
jgi:hypothetical protein